MVDIVIDVQVLMFASGTGKAEDAACCRRLLTAVSEGDTTLAVDDGQLILTQYANKMGAGSLGLEWVKRLLNKGRVRFVGRATINKGDRVALQEAGFGCSSEDFHYYVRTTVASEGRRLVSEDSDYTDAVKRLLKKRFKMRVFAAESALSELGASKS